MIRETLKIPYPLGVATLGVRFVGTCLQPEKVVFDTRDLLVTQAATVPTVRKRLERLRTETRSTPTGC